MKRFLLITLFAGLLAAGWALSDQVADSIAAGAVSGQGKMKFRVLYTSSHLPAEAQSILKDAHGGFAVDRRPGKGETYFALPGAGILQISSDLKKIKVLPTDPAMKAANMHNATIWYGSDGNPYLTFPGNKTNLVYATGIDGKLLGTLGTPSKGVDVGHPIANTYFENDGPFIPTDTEQLDGMLYIPTGYSKLDFVLTAKILSTKPFKAEWYDMAFGGKGEGVGQFGTGHGVTIPPGTKRIDIADRPNAEIDRFTRHGQYIETVHLPEGSFPCDIDYLDEYGIIGALHGPDRTKGAPIYILEDDKVISTIMIKEDLGLENFQHIHNAVMHKVNGKRYLIAQAWNPGDFAILEHVE